MRTVTFAMNISLDGYCDHTAFNPAEEVLDYFTGILEGVDLLFFGRVMYQLMFPYWSDVAESQSGTVSENKFAERFSAIDRVVVSRTLAGDEKTRIVRGNPVEALRELKQQPGGKISVDSVSMLPAFIGAGLIDEFKLVVHPGMVGQGRLLLDAGSLSERLDLTLVDTVHFKSGCVSLHYVKK